MKALISKKLLKAQTVELKLSLLREFLQNIVLSIFDKRGYFMHWAFLGGTALRMLYDLKRFSEDLDFSLLYESKKRLSISDVVAALLHDLKAWNFKVEAGKIKEGKLSSCFMRFPAILNEFGITDDPRKKISIKIEVDMNPPRDYSVESTPLQKDIFFMVTHHDLPSLFAGKAHAFLFRGYTKGRDIYDLAWFLTKGVNVNSKQLRNAIIQTEGECPELSIDRIKNMMVDKIKTLNMKEIKRDLSPFLEDQDEMRIIDQSFLLKALEIWGRGES